MKKNCLSFFMLVGFQFMGFAQLEYFNDLFFVDQEASNLSTNLLIKGDTIVSIGATLYNDQLLLAIRKINSQGFMSSLDLKEVAPFYPLLADAVNQMESIPGYIYGMAWANSCGLIRFDENFDTTWSLSYLPQNAAINGFFQAREYENEIVAGGVNGVDMNADGFAEYNAILLSEFSLDGDLIEEHQFELYEEDFGCAPNMFFPLGNNEFLFTARKGALGGPMPLLMVKANTESGVVSNYMFGSEILINGNARAIQEPDGKIRVCYGYPNSYLFDDYSHPDISIRVFEFDPILMQPVQEIISLPSLNDYSIIQDFSSTPDGGYSICGETAIVEYTNPNDPNSITSWETFGFLVKLDNLFQHQWTELFQFPDPTPDALGEFHQFWDMEVTSDGGFAVVGTWKENYSGPQRTWVVKTDCMGKLAFPELSLDATVVQDSNVVQVMSSGTGVYNFQWAFGDGSLLQGNEMTYTYPEPGEYEIIASAQYCSMTLDTTIVVQVLDCAGNVYPPDLAINPSVIQVDFTTTAQFEVNPQNLENIEWNFGEGWIAGDQLEYMFPNLGEFTVHVQGTYCDSLFADSLTVVLTDCMGNTEVPVLSLNPIVVELDDTTFQFDCSPVNLESIIWYFGDGDSIVIEDTQHSYSGIGIYDVLVCGYYCDSIYCEYLQVEVELGIIDLNNSEGFIHPNPFNDYVRISGFTGPVTVKIYNSIGDLLYQIEENSIPMKLVTSHLRSGVYVFEVIDESFHTWTYKLSK